MDPDEALRLLRLAVGRMRADGGAADEAAEHFEALDGWLSRGGFLPRDWANSNL